MNHNCSRLLIRRIHAHFVVLFHRTLLLYLFLSFLLTLRVSLPASRVPLPLKFHLSFSPPSSLSFFLSLSFDFSLPLLSLWAARGTAPPPPPPSLGGGKITTILYFLYREGKKEDNFWWKRNNFIGRCYVRSVGVYCRCALHLPALCAPIRNGTNVLPNVTLAEGQVHDLFSAATSGQTSTAAILVTLLEG